MAIDIGGTFLSAAYNTGNGWTYVWPENVANASGVLDTVNVSVPVSGVQGLVVGTVPLDTAPNFTFRDWADLGDLEDGDHVISGLSIDVVVGDSIGHYNLGGNIFYYYSVSPTPGYAHYYYWAGNGIDGNSHDFTYDGTFYQIFGYGASGTETPVTTPSAGAKKAARIFQRFG